jgi:hypothetical protein
VIAVPTSVREPDRVCDANYVVNLDAVGRLRSNARLNPPSYNVKVVLGLGSKQQRYDCFTLGAIYASVMSAIDR